MFLDTANEIWEDVHDTYSIKKNTFSVFEAYADLFSFRQCDKNLENYYNHFKGMSDDINQYHPVTNDNEVLKKQCE